MNYVWAALAFVPLLVVLVRYLTGRNVLDNSMLLLGLGMYWFMPFFAYASGSFVDGPGEEVWAREFEALYASGAAFLALSAGLALAYGIGQCMPAPPLGRSLNVALSRASLRRLLLALCALWAFFAFRARDEFGMGYLVEYKADLMGPLATVNLVALLGLLNLKQWRQSKRLDLGYSALLLANSALLLSMGGRMYVVTCFVALFLQYINARRRQPAERAWLLVIVAGVLGALMLVGLWRLDAAIEFRLLVLTALAEPLLTSISLASYASCGQVEMLAFPSNFLGTFINFVPSILLPDKAALVPELDPNGQCIVAPFGASHVGPALMVNFGLVGAACFVALFSYLLKASQTVQARGWWFHYYICGLLPFMFFRDAFMVFNKALIGSGLLVAIVLVWMDRLRIVRRFRTTRPAAPIAPAP
jgi:hypothetical membrane protein